MQHHNHQIKQESSILRVSVIANFLLAIVALYYGITTKSEAIKLDGYYSFASFILALISLWIVKIITKPESSNYNFGYAIIEPLFNLVKGLMILAVVLSSLVNASQSLLSGGNTPSFGDSIIYFIISTITCFILTLLFYKRNKEQPSPIIHVEYKNWFIDTIISGSIGLAFITSYLMQGTTFDSWIKYTDPIITLGIIIFIIRLPLTTIKVGIREIMLAVPEKDIIKKLNDLIKDSISAFDVEDYTFKATKTGRELYLIIYIQITNEKDTLQTLKAQDKLREKINNKLNNIFDLVKFDIVFSENKLLHDF